jgi:hypothetical protein
MAPRTIHQPPLDAFEQHPGLRGPLKRIRALDREAWTLFKKVKKSAPDKKDREELDRLRNETSRERIELALPARRDGVIRELRSFVISEAKRFPEILRHKSHKAKHTEWNILKQAALTAFEGIPVPVEYEAALSTIYESPEWIAFRRERSRIRTKARLEEGYWKKPAVKRAKRAREAARRAAMTPEEHEELKASRREAYAEKCAAKRRYEDMLGEPLQGQRAAASTRGRSSSASPAASGLRPTSGGPSGCRSASMPGRSSTAPSGGSPTRSATPCACSSWRRR